MRKSSLKAVAPPGYDTVMMGGGNQYVEVRRSENNAEKCFNLMRN